MIDLIVRGVSQRRLIGGNQRSSKTLLKTRTTLFLPVYLNFCPGKQKRFKFNTESWMENKEEGRGAVDI